MMYLNEKTRIQIDIAKRKNGDINIYGFSNNSGSGGSL